AKLRFAASGLAHDDNALSLVWIDKLFSTFDWYDGVHLMRCFSKSRRRISWSVAILSYVDSFASITFNCIVACHCALSICAMLSAARTTSQMRNGIIPAHAIIDRRASTVNVGLEATRSDAVMLWD